MKTPFTLLAGFLFGAMSWGLAHVISGRFEPYDSGTGLLVTQIILSAAAATAGFRQGIAAATILTTGAYLGLNGYSYAFGSSEARAWAMLGALTSIGLVLFPALSGVVGGIVKRVAAKARQPT